MKTGIRVSPLPRNEVDKILMNVGSMKKIASLLVILPIGLNVPSSVFAQDFEQAAIVSEAAAIRLVYLPKRFR